MKLRSWFIEQSSAAGVHGSDARKAAAVKAREHAEAIDTAKKPETRTRRIARAVAAIPRLPAKKK